MTILLDSLEVGDITLRNRITLPPMHTGLATEKGEVTNELINHYAQRAKVLGLLIVEHSYVSARGKHSERQLGIYNDNLIPGLKRLAQRIHQEETPIVIQLNHAGNQAREEVTGLEPIGPSPQVEDNGRELEQNEIEQIIQEFAQANRRAVEAGFDGVEIHGAHGFLLDQFFSPLTNKRNDQYGGLFEDRVRLPLKIVEEAKKRIGKKLLLYRLGADDLHPEGIKIEEAKRFGKLLEEAGVDIIDVSGGICGSRPASLRGKQGYFIPQASQIKETVDVPIIGVGGITDPKYADKLVRKGQVDLVAVGRAQLSEPGWAKRAIEDVKETSHNNSGVKEKG